MSLYQLLTKCLRFAAALGVLCVVVAALAQAATPIQLTASPHIASRGQTVRLRGSGWGVIEFCKPRVTLMLARSAPLKPLAIATVKLRTGLTNSGTFSTSWTISATVHSGLRTIVATQRCESGKNGSIHLITRTTTVRVK